MRASCSRPRSGSSPALRPAASRRGCLRPTRPKDPPARRRRPPRCRPVRCPPARSARPRPARHGPLPQPGGQGGAAGGRDLCRPLRPGSHGYPVAHHPHRPFTGRDQRHRIGIALPPRPAITDPRGPALDRQFQVRGNPAAHHCNPSNGRPGPPSHRTEHSSRLEHRPSIENLGKRIPGGERGLHRPGAATGAMPLGRRDVETDQPSAFSGSTEKAESGRSERRFPRILRFPVAMTRRPFSCARIAFR